MDYPGFALEQKKKWIYSSHFDKWEPICLPFSRSGMKPMGDPKIYEHSQPEPQEHASDSISFLIFFRRHSWARNEAHLVEPLLPPQGLLRLLLRRPTPMWSCLWLPRLRQKGRRLTTPSCFDKQICHLLPQLRFCFQEKSDHQKLRVTTAIKKK